MSVCLSSCLFTVKLCSILSCRVMLYQVMVVCECACLTYFSILSYVLAFSVCVKFYFDKCRSNTVQGSRQVMITWLGRRQEEGKEDNVNITLLFYARNWLCYFFFFLFTSIRTVIGRLLGNNVTSARDTRNRGQQK